MRHSRILFVFLVLGCASINTQILEETENIGELITQHAKTEDIPIVQPTSPVIEVKSQETETTPNETIINEAKAEEAPNKEESVTEEEKPKEVVKEEAPHFNEANPTEATETMITEQEAKLVDIEITKPVVSEEKAESTEEKKVDKIDDASAEAQITEKPHLNNQSSIYGFVALIFSMSVIYMAFLIYQQNKKYDFLNHDIHDDMGYELLEDHN